MTEAKRQYAIDALTGALRIPILADTSHPDFHRWQGHTTAALGSVYGHDSSLVTQFQQIKFEATIDNTDYQRDQKKRQAFQAGCVRAEAMLTQLLEAMKHEPTDEPPAPQPQPVKSKTRKQEAVEKLEAARQELNSIDGAPSERFNHWQRKTHQLLAEVFDNDPSVAERFQKINYTPRSIPRLSTGDIRGGRGQSIDDAQREAHVSGCNDAKRMLDDLITLVPDDPGPHGQDESPASAPQAINTKIFIVHGHDSTLRQMVARYVSALGLEPKILQEQPDRGQTVIEKFERESDVGYAIILATGDDLAAAVAELAGKTSNLSPDELHAQARQNVTFEAGFFVGKHGRGRVMIIKGDDVRLPSDLAGVVYSTLHNWQKKMFRELRAAGYEFTPDQIDKALSID
jgi:predicted nucleotide-binding protein